LPIPRLERLETFLEVNKQDREAWAFFYEAEKRERKTSKDTQNYFFSNKSNLELSGVISYKYKPCGACIMEAKWEKLCLN